jgi:hypothetical protein
MFKNPRRDTGMVVLLRGNSGFYTGCEKEAAKRRGCEKEGPDLELSVDLVNR